MSSDSLCAKVVVQVVVVEKLPMKRSDARKSVFSSDDDDVNDLDDDDVDDANTFTNGRRITERFCGGRAESKRVSSFTSFTSFCYDPVLDDHKRRLSSRLLLWRSSRK